MGHGNKEARKSAGEGAAGRGGGGDPGVVAGTGVCSGTATCRVGNGRESPGNSGKTHTGNCGRGGRRRGGLYSYVVGRLIERKMTFDEDNVPLAVPNDFPPKVDSPRGLPEHLPIP
jgi:hypothetical protein